MAEFGTLDDLLAVTDPVAHGNSVPDSETADPNTSNDTPPSGQPPGSGAAGDLDARIRAMEERLERVTTQANGSRAEEQRQRQRAEELERKLQEALAQQRQAEPPSTQRAPGRKKLLEAIRQAVQRDDFSSIEEWASQDDPVQPAVDPHKIREDVRAELQQFQQAQQVERDKEAALNLMRGKYAARLAEDAPFAAAVGRRYQALIQDPTAKYLYPADPQGVYQIEAPGTGMSYDIRALFRAAEQVDLEHQAAVGRQGGPTMGTNQGSPPRARESYTKAIPRDIITHVQSPELLAGLQRQYPGKSPAEIVRAEAELHWSGISESRRQEYLRLFRGGSLDMVGFS